MKARMKPDERRQQILSAALIIAERDGYNALTRDGIALEAGVATGLVNHVYSTMAKLRNNVMRAAVHRELKPIIAQGLAQGDEIAHQAPEWLKRASLDLLLEN
jgi:AcrR family transcriptional regulator